MNPALNLYIYNTLINIKIIFGVSSVVFIMCFLFAFMECSVVSTQRKLLIGFIISIIISALYPSKECLNLIFFNTQPTIAEEIKTE